jgi:hypothetical protein
MDKFLKHLRTLFLLFALKPGVLHHPLFRIYMQQGRWKVPYMYMLNNKSEVIILPREAVIELNCGVPFSLFAAGTIV